MPDERRNDTNLIHLPSSGREPSASLNGMGSTESAKAELDPVVAAQTLTASASLPEILQALKTSHLRLTMSVEAAIELIDNRDLVLARAYLEVAGDETPLLNQIEGLLEKKVSE